MTLWLAIGLLTLLAAGAVVWRLGIARASTPQGGFDRAVYRDQLAELQRDVERGVLSPGEAEGARLEIQRRLLATDEAEAPASAGGGDAVMAAAVAGLVSALAIAIYFGIGSPGLRDAPLADRTASQSAEGAGDLAAKVAALEARLKQDPGDGEGWLLLGRGYALQQRWAEAGEAYKHAMSLPNAGAAGEAASSYGEVLVTAADGIVTPAARDAFGEALAKDPRNAPARYYLALADAQAGKPAEALAAWRALLADSPPDAPWLAMLREQMTNTAREAGLPPPDLAAGPPVEGAGTGTAAMGAAERQKMIRSMVDGLATRLEHDPGDVAGWARLANAYHVLGEAEKAAEAERRGIAALPPAAGGAAGVPALLQRVHFLLEASGASHDLRRPLADDLVAVLHDIAERDPDQPEALWYLGLAAAQRHDVKTAVANWQRLLGLLPQGTNEYKTVEAALGALQSPK